MGYSVALDIGTTNIQALLVDASSKREIDYLTIKNSQIVYGEDIITRLGLSLRNKDLQEKIKKSLDRDLTLLIGAILKRREISFNELEKVFACGNSAMHHILLGLPLENLARAPFKPNHIGKIFETTLGEIGIELENCEKTPFVFLPNLGGFVGSDALCAIVETELYKSAEPILIIDLGTNGEIILGSKEKIFVTSTAAGPAFEGWRIKCGVYGSTLIDIVDELLKKGAIVKSGFMEKGSFKYEVGRRAVEVTQKDVREFQLAKAAIASGINILKENFVNKEIRKVFITGLFGTRLNKYSARSTGVLPEHIDLKGVRFKPNLALLGAKTLLLSGDFERKLESIIKKVEHIELHKIPHFQDTFASAIHF